MNGEIWCSCISLPTKVQLYHTYIQPVLLYGSETWALTRALQDKVDSIDNMFFAPYPSHSIHVPRNQRQAKTPSRLTAPAVSAHPGQTTSIFSTRGKDGHVSLDINRVLKVSIRGLPKDWRRKPGRPRHTWLRILEADLQPLNLGLNSAWIYTQDREHWKHLVETATLQLGACS